MNVYNASYDDYWNFSGYEEIECIVIANTKEEALGLVITEYDDLPVKNWEINKIDNTKLKVMTLRYHSS